MFYWRIGINKAMSHIWTAIKSRLFVQFNVYPPNCCLGVCAAKRYTPAFRTYYFETSERMNERIMCMLLMRKVRSIYTAAKWIHATNTGWINGVCVCVRVCFNVVYYAGFRIINGSNIDKWNGAATIDVIRRSNNKLWRKIDSIEYW